MVERTPLPSSRVSRMPWSGACANSAAAVSPSGMSPSHRPLTLARRRSPPSSRSCLDWLHGGGVLRLAIGVGVGGGEAGARLRRPLAYRPAGRVGTPGCPGVPLTEPDLWTTHPALRDAGVRERPVVQRRRFSPAAIPAL